MRLSKIEITNIRGIEHLVIEPGTFTVISGKNAEGKSSIILALQALVSGGHDPSLIRLGADSASVIAAFDDGSTITLKIAPKKSDREVRDEKGRKISAPQSIIDELVDIVSFNPLGKFLDGTDKERVALLMESLPITVSPADLKKAKIKLPPGQTLNGHGLEVLARLHKFYYDARRDHNRDLKSKRATIAELSEGLPAPDDQIEALYDAAQGELNTLESEKREQIAALDNSEREEKKRFGDVFIEAESKIKNDLDAAIQKLRDEAAMAIEGARLVRDREVSATNVRHIASRGEVENSFAQEIAAKNAQLGSLKAKAEQSQQAKGTRDTLAKMRAEADGIAELAQEADASLTAIEALKERLTADIPIPGLEITDGKILINEIPLDSLNTGDQIEDVAVEIALLRAKDLRCIVMDGGERLDSEHLARLKATAEKKNLQVLITRVSDSELEIATS